MRKLVVLLGLGFIVVLVIIYGLPLLLPDLQLPLLSGRDSRGIDIDTIKPAAWQRYGRNLVPLNIDEDEDQELILFYTYDGGNIGGVVYDPQTSPLGNESVPLPDQPSTFLVPYQLLPDYSYPKTNGYLGDDRIDYRTAVALPQYSPPRADRLLVRGFRNNNVTRFSVFWWLNENKGYGGAHAYTTGWFSLSYDRPHDWLLWKNKTANITELWAWEPMANRSNLCRRTYWTITESDVNDAGSRRFERTQPSDITFCNGVIPREPAFPEGQVLAYLHDADPQRLLQPENTRFPKYPGAVVDKITSPEWLSVESGNTDANRGDIFVNVDVDFLLDGNPYATRWTVIMLRPASIRETIHWRITNVALR